MAQAGRRSLRSTSATRDISLSRAPASGKLRAGGMRSRLDARAAFSAAIAATSLGSACCCSAPPAVCCPPAGRSGIAWLGGGGSPPGAALTQLEAVCAGAGSAAPALGTAAWLAEAALLRTDCGIHTLRLTAGWADPALLRASCPAVSACLGCAVLAPSTAAGWAEPALLRTGCGIRSRQTTAGWADPTLLRAGCPVLSPFLAEPSLPSDRLIVPALGGDG